MNILMAFNDGFLLPAIVSIASLFTHNNNVKLYILYIELSNTSKTIIKKLEKYGDNNTIEFTYVTQEYLDKIIVPTGRWRPETFFRHFAFEIYTEIEKMLWLDSDILVRGNLDELYNTNISEYSFAAVEDASSNPVERLGINKYVNAGILLMNLKKLQKNDSMNQFWNLLADKSYKAELPDQDALNIIFEKDILHVSHIWNNTPIFISEYYDYYINNTRIIHYSSSHKPWKNEDWEYYLNLFEQYPSVSIFVPEYWDFMEKIISEL